MIYEKNTVKDIKIAYIGGGSRGWAWGFMSDLAMSKDISGDVYLYDIDKAAAQNNEIIGNKIKELDDCNSVWNYKAVDTIGEALTGCDFVIISILPGTFDEMESDVHAPEKYGIYQSVGDSTGPGGIIRALRTVPMFIEIANAIKQYSPKAWVINYTNPMTLCTATLYSVFPEIKAFGCCHEVFGTQKLIAKAVEEFVGIEQPQRAEIKVNPVGINHFTWLTSVKYKDMDLIDIYSKFVDKYYDGYGKSKDDNWINNTFYTEHRIKFDLFRRFGYIAAAGDRHLAEFCPGDWYLKNPEQVKDWKFTLTTVDWRRKDLKSRLERSKRLASGEERFRLVPTGEDGVNQMRALLGLDDLVTNVNIPNYGQIPNLPLGAVVETNAVFTDDKITPVFAGAIPEIIYPLISRICGEQEMVRQAAFTHDLNLAFQAFMNDPLVRLNTTDGKVLFNEMINNTKQYLKDYKI